MSEDYNEDDDNRKVETDLPENYVLKLCEYEVFTKDYPAMAMKATPSILLTFVSILKQRRSNTQTVFHISAFPVSTSLRKLTA